MANRADPNSTGIAANVDRVLRRIGRYASAWQAPSIRDHSLHQRDWERICAHAQHYGRDASKIQRMQTVHLVLSEDASVIGEAYGRAVGKDFDDPSTRNRYLSGSAAQIIEDLHQRAELGIDRIILTPVSDDVGQLDRWVAEVIKPLNRLLANPG